MPARSEELWPENKPRPITRPNPVNNKPVKFRLRSGEGVDFPRDVDLDLVFLVDFFRVLAIGILLRRSFRIIA
jgi:hypothetical protein